MKNTPAPESPAPRWTALLALIAVALLNLALPESLSLGPNWLLMAIIGPLTIPTVMSHRAGRHDWNQILGFAINSIETVALTGSVALLVTELLSGQSRGPELLRAGGLLWISNVLIFALWYWRIDAGGPHRREARAGHPTGDFLFPQMTITQGDPNFDAQWSPEFVDYLFLSFNSATALSPTDSPVLSRPAKVLMMMQSLIALTIIVVLVGRAINVL